MLQAWLVTVQLNMKKYRVLLAGSTLRWRQGTILLPKSLQVSKFFSNRTVLNFRARSLWHTYCRSRKRVWTYLKRWQMEFFYGKKVGILLDILRLLNWQCFQRFDQHGCSWNDWWKGNQPDQQRETVTIWSTWKSRLGAERCKRNKNLPYFVQNLKSHF